MFWLSANSIDHFLFPALLALYKPVMGNENKKMRIYSFIFAILLSEFTFGQNHIFVSEQEMVIDSLEINNIENIVDSIRLDKTLQKISIDSISLSSKFSNEQKFHEVDIYYKGNEIVRIILSQSDFNLAFQYSVGGSSVDYFLENSKLIFADEKYTDNSRTGSCGAIEMQNNFYYDENELIQTRTNGECYQPHIKLEWLYANFERVYQISIEKIN